MLVTWCAQIMTSRKILELLNFILPMLAHHSQTWWVISSWKGKTLFSFLIFSFCIFLCRCRQCRAHFFGSLGKISLYHQCDGSAPLRLQCFVKISTNVSISDISPKSQSRKTRLFQKLISKPLLTPKRCLAKISSTKKHFLEVTRCDGISCEWCFQILCFVSPVQCGSN